VSRHLLDTNIISNVTKPVPSTALVAWMEEQAGEDLFICSLTVAEIWRGLPEKPAGKKRKELENWFSGPDGPKRCLLAACFRSMRRPALSGRA